VRLRSLSHWRDPFDTRWMHNQDMGVTISDLTPPSAGSMVLDGRRNSIRLNSPFRGNTLDLGHPSFGVVRGHARLSTLSHPCQKAPRLFSVYEKDQELPLRVQILLWMEGTQRESQRVTGSSERSGRLPFGGARGSAASAAPEMRSPLGAGFGTGGGAEGADGRHLTNRSRSARGNYHDP
jgi:hypothetical protein